MTDILIEKPIETFQGLPIPGTQSPLTIYLAILQRANNVLKVLTRQPVFSSLL